MFDKIICHDNVENISKIIDEKIQKKIKFLDFPIYNYSNLKNKKSKLYTIGFAGIISKIKILKYYPHFLKIYHQRY